MPFLIEHIEFAVKLLIVIGLILGGGITLVTVQRRLTRARYFQKLDRTRHRAGEVVDPLYESDARVNEALPILRSFRSDLERRALEEQLLAHTKSSQQLARTREILHRLGWIREWTDTVRCRVRKPSGQVGRVLAELGDSYRSPTGVGRLRLRLRSGYMERCRVANKLALVPTPEGLLALLAGTEDPHLDVEEVCIRNLGRLADPATLPVLLEGMIKVIEGRSRLSVRHLKTALVQFPLEEVDALRGILQHSHRRVRFFATDIVREIADRRAGTEVLSKNDFSPDMYRLFTTHLWQDQWGDVRARAAVEPRFEDLEIAISLDVPANPKSMILGESAIEIPSGLKVGTQVERAARDWISYQLRWDLTGNPLPVSSVVDYHEGKFLTNLMSLVPAEVYPLAGTLVAKKGEKWFAPDETGTFRFEVLKHKVQYPTVHASGSFGWIEDTHGISALVSQALARRLPLVVGSGDSEDAAKAAFYLAQRGVNVVFPGDQFQHLLLGYEGQGVLLGTTPLKKLDGKVVLAGC